MGLRKRTAVICSLLTTVFMIASMATPWWWTYASNRNNKVTNCWIDGTCRSGGEVFKNNGDAQPVFDTTLILMLLGLACLVLFVHFVFCVKNPERYPTVPAKRLITFILGVITFALILAAVILFAIQIPRKYEGSNEFFDEQDVGDIHYEWGGHAGWILALFTLFTLLWSVFCIAIVKGTDRGYYHEPLHHTTFTVSTHPSTH